MFGMMLNVMKEPGWVIYSMLGTRKYTLQWIPTC